MSKEDLAHSANVQLQGVLLELQDARKILARDWEKLTPRERSAHTRQVKLLEAQQKSLCQELELLAVEITNSP